MRAFAQMIVIPFALLAAVACSENGLQPMDYEDTGEPFVPPDPTGDADTDEPQAPGEPIADAGPDRIIETGDTLALDGTLSYDPDGLEPLTYAWTLASAPSGSSASLDNAAAARPVFSADRDGMYVFALTVQNSEGTWDSTPDEVVVTAEADPILEPVANAGADQSVTEDDLVNLNGSNSFDPDNLVPLTYQWSTVSRPTGSSASLNNTTIANPYFIADQPGAYVFQLTVGNTGGVWDSTPDTVRITAAEKVIDPPVAAAGPDQAVTTGTVVFVDGGASYDPAGLTPLTWSWTITSKPSGSTASLTAPAQAVTGFTADKVGSYTLSLTVKNTAGIWDPTPDTLVVNASAPVIQEPVSNAGPDQVVAPLATVQLSGTASYDPGGYTPLTYEWTMVSRPSGSTTTLSSTTSATPTFFADLAGDYTISLRVRNSQGVWDSTPDQVLVVANPADGFYVQLSWDAYSDLDLHVLNGQTALFRWGDCNYCNQTPSWGVAGTADDPSLDWDAIYGYGPETTTITVPSAGEYEIDVHYYGQEGHNYCTYTSCPASTATVRIYLGSVLAKTYTRTMYQSEDLWKVARVSWPSGSITTINSLSYTSEYYCQ